MAAVLRALDAFGTGVLDVWSFLERLLCPSPGLAVEAQWRGPFSPAFLILGGQTILAFVLYATDGHENWVATIYLEVMLVMLARALLGLHRGVAVGLRSAVRPIWVIAVAQVIAALNVVFSPPGINVRGSMRPFLAMQSCALLLLLTYGVDVFFDRRPSPAFARARRLGLALAAAAIGLWILQCSPNPHIDLFPVQTQAAQAMLAGRSIYEPGAIHTKETFNNTDLLDEYTYFPLPACFTTLAWLLGRDVRWASFAAQLVSAWLLWWLARRSSGKEPPTRRDAWSELLAWALLFHPRGPFVLEQAWTEPLAMPFLGAVAALLIIGRPRWAAVAFGLLAAMKQHLFLYAPFLALLPGIGPVGLVIALATSLGTILPFAVPNPHGFYRGVFVMLVHNPFRTDALSIPADIHRFWHWAPPTWVGFAAGMLPLAWLPIIRRSLPALILASGLAFGLFYLFGRQAFCNYYYLLNATLLFVLATLSEPEPAASPPESSAVHALNPASPDRSLVSAD